MSDRVTLLLPVEGGGNTHLKVQTYYYLGGESYTSYQKKRVATTSR